MQSEIDSLYEEAVILICVLYYEWSTFGKITDKTKNEFSDLAKLIARKQKEKTMSWGIKTAGRTKDVLAEVNDNQYVPQYVKDAVTAIATDNQTKEGKSLPPCDGLYVEGHGHQGAGCPSSLRLKVEPFKIAPAAPEGAPPVDFNAAAPEGAPASTGSA